MPSSSMNRFAVALAFVAMSAASAALAHVTVSPRQAVSGERETYAIRAPNERRSATVRIEGDFPSEVKVSSFEAKPGWTIEPKRDAAGAITGATWTGVLPPDQVVEFRIVAQNPRTAGTLTWRFTQVYADGETVSWSGAKGSRTPAPEVEIIAPVH